MLGPVLLAASGDGHQQATFVEAIKRDRSRELLGVRWMSASRATECRDCSYRAVRVAIGAGRSNSPSTLVGDRPGSHLEDTDVGATNVTARAAGCLQARGALRRRAPLLPVLGGSVGPMERAAGRAQQPSWERRGDACARSIGPRKQETVEADGRLLLEMLAACPV